jgi:hypothetical protein
MLRCRICPQAWEWATFNDEDRARYVNIGAVGEWCM